MSKGLDSKVPTVYLIGRKMLSINLYYDVALTWNDDLSSQIEFIILLVDENKRVHIL